MAAPDASLTSQQLIARLGKEEQLRSDAFSDTSFHFNSAGILHFFFLARSSATLVAFSEPSDVISYRDILLKFSLKYQITCISCIFTSDLSISRLSTLCNATHTPSRGRVRIPVPTPNLLPF